jgi:murein L,D-transpeptidase YcbB/YkuD
VNELRNKCTGPVPVHFFQKLSLITATALAAAVPLNSAQAASATAVAAPAPPQFTQTSADFYRARKDAPLWLTPAAGDAAEQLISLLSTASLDGLNPDKYRPAALRAAVEAARKGKHKLIEAADRQLSDAFSAYVADMRRDPGVGITYVDPQLRPVAPTPLAALLEAASAPSLSTYVRDLGWMHPFYGDLRDALAEHKYSDDHQRELIQLNLQRSKALPASRGKYVLVNAAQQRLYMYDGGKPVDSMVVVVGKPKWPTPMLTAYIRFAALNPYWYVPPDLAGEDVGQFVV